MRTDAGRVAAKASPKKGRRRRARVSRSSILLRWCAVGALAFAAFLYYRPLATYVETRQTLNERRAEVSELRAERLRLEARLTQSTSIEAVAREARRMSLVRPGERLFVVKGIREWRRAQRSTIPKDG